MVTIADQETISWISVAEQLPDADTTVLVCAPRSSEPIWLGYYDEEDSSWHSVDVIEYDEGDVIAWARMPSGVASAPGRTHEQ